MNLRHRIADAAMEEFRASGLGFTMADVAGRLRISKKTIYKEYESKEKLLIGMLEQGYAEIHAQKKAILESGASLREKLRRVVIALPDEYRTLDFRQLEHIGDKYPMAARALKQQLTEGWEPTLALIREGMESGQLRPFNVSVFRLMVIGSIESFLNSGALQEEEISYEAALEAMMDILMDGLMDGLSAENTERKTL